MAAKRMTTLSEDHDAWEDVDEIVDVLEPRTNMECPPSPSGSASVSGSRRRRPTKTLFVATTPRKQRTTAAVAERELQHTSPRVRRPSKEGIVDAAIDGTLYTGQYVFDVLHQAIRILRRPLGILFGLWLLGFVIAQVKDTLTSAFSPICILPWVGDQAWCRGPTHGADYPRMMEVQGDRFEQLLKNGVGGSTLSSEIKLAQMATADLATLVRVSNLQSRDLLAESLMDFVDDAKKTGRGLQKLGAKIGGSVDQIFAVNDHALHTIEGAIANAPGRFSLGALVPWKSGPTTDEVVRKTFDEAMSVLSAQMTRLMIEAAINIKNLDTLEERLSTIHELISREDSTISSARDELLSNLWTRLGQNKKELRGHSNQLLLLKNLGRYRKTALAHVASAMSTLQAMSDDMEDLRERVSAPEVVGERISVQVHIGSIKNGLERLRNGRTNAKEREKEAVRRMLGPGFD